MADDFLTRTIEQLPALATRPANGVLPVSVGGVTMAMPVRFLGEGEPGPANSTFKSRAEMAEQAPPTNVSAIVLGDGTYTFVTGDLAALIAAEPANFVASAFPGAPQGAWVRLPGEGGYASLAALKLGEYVVGQSVTSSLYGGASRWVCKAEVILQNHFVAEPLQSSKVDFDDELHLVVNLAGGGKAILECQVGSIQGFVANEVTRLYNEQFNRFERKLSLARIASLFIFGDSITYGQTAPQLAGADRIETGFGDGSKHEWTKVAGAWPETLLSLLSEVHGPGKVAVTNRGYSGDRVGSGYRRHRFAGTGGQTISLIAYGTNDVLFGSSNGTRPDLLFASPDGYGFDRFTPALRKFVYREVVRGSLPILAAPFVWSSLVGYDGTSFAAGKIAGAYRMAIRAVADEIGAGFVDWSSIINARDVGSQTSDGVHPNAEGHTAIAARTVPLLMGKGWRYRTDVYGTLKLMPVPHVENVAGRSVSAAGDLALTANGFSFGKPFTNANDASDLIIGEGERRFFAFYCHVDEMAVMPVGYANNGTTLIYALNFGIEQGKARLNCRRGAAQGQRVSFSSSRQIVNATGASLPFNHPGRTRDHLVIQGRGWHVLTLHVPAGAVVLSGILFDSRLGEIGAAIESPTLATPIAAASGGATVDAEARAVIQSLIASNQELQSRVVSVLDLLRDRSAIAS